MKQIIVEVKFYWFTANQRERLTRIIRNIVMNTWSPFSVHFFFVQIKYIKIHEFQLSVECCRFKCFGIIFYLSLFSCINWADDDKSKVANMSILLRTNNDGH